MWGLKLLIHSQTSKFGMDKKFNLTHYDGCNYLSILRLMLNHVNKRSPLWRMRQRTGSSWFKYGLSPVRCQVIALTNYSVLPVGPLACLEEKKNQWKWRPPFCVGLIVSSPKRPRNSDICFQSVSKGWKPIEKLSFIVNDLWPNDMGETYV